MSIKGTLLSTILPVPQTANNYMVIIPGIYDSGILCHSASLPLMRRDEVTINVSGQPVYLPSKSQVPGTWSCSLYESAGSKVLRELDALKSKEVQYVDGSPSEYNLHDVYIFLLNSIEAPSYCCTLKGAWIVESKLTELSAQGADTPVNLDITFRYQYCTYL